MMNVTLPYWIIPVFVTVVVWAWLILLPNRDHGIGAAVTAYIRLVCGAMITLVTWLVYLAVRLWMVS